VQDSFKMRWMKENFYNFFSKKQIKLGKDLRFSTLVIMEIINKEFNIFFSFY